MPYRLHFGKSVKRSWFTRIQRKKNSLHSKYFIDVEKALIKPQSKKLSSDKKYHALHGTNILYTNGTHRFLFQREFISEDHFFHISLLSKLQVKKFLKFRYRSKSCLCFRDSIAQILEIFSLPLPDVHDKLIIL